MCIRLRRLAWLILALPPALAADRAAVRAQAPAWLKAEHPEGINQQFRDPGLDARQYAKRFESESREVARQKVAIANAVGLEPGMAVADIGAGTGLYTRLFAERVGPQGKVYAVDIAPAFLRHIDEEARWRGQGGVIATVQGTQDSPNLPPNAIDVAFLCDTYHHIERPAPMLAAIHRALRPGGRLVVVDLDRRPGARDFVAKHVRAEKAVFFREIEAAGFKPMAITGAPDLKENFFAMFRKVPAPRSEAIPATPPRSHPGGDTPR